MTAPTPPPYTARELSYREVRDEDIYDVPPLSVAGQFRARGYFNCSA
jgi:hypothetical protein